MADYYSILKKTLSGLPRNTVENRSVVYGKARQAIDRQLRALEPTPPEDAIARQMKLLEHAIETVEAEFAGQAGQAAPAASPPAVQAAPSRAPAPASPAPAAPRPRAPVQTQQGGQPIQPARQAAPAPSAPRQATPTPSAPTQSAPRQAAAPGQAPAVARGAGNGTPAYDAMLDELDEYDRAPQGRQRVSALGREKPRGGWFVSLVVTLVVLAILAAGGYALWRNKEPLLAALGLEDLMMPGSASDKPDTGNNGEESSTVAPDGQGDDGKEDVRLNQSGETVPGQAGEEALSRPVRDAGQPSTAPAESTAQPQEPPAAEQPVQVNPVGQDGAQGQQESAAASEQGQSGALPPPAIAQKAYLYEEGGAGAGATRDNAAIVWSLDEQSPGDGMPPEAVIQGQFDVPGRGLVMQITIRRNVDEALPASHIIELRFDTPADFSGGEIDNVARFVMKSSEQARGEGLIAVPAKIDTGYFLIALNNLAQAQETNRKLLTASSWIDIPVGYTSGRRALVTLEKGAIGDKVFKDAFADWDTR
ncbi:MAG: hypothetical protein KDJ90_09965 [Nitratireductor sp.]|nr:hypothetical protein [Nitratireductor sp.]